LECGCHLPLFYGWRCPTLLIAPVRWLALDKARALFHFTSMSQTLEK
jgi:hypothetical protein